MLKPRINLIYAISQNGIIGNAGSIPWSIPADLKRFSELTRGDIVIMGRKTWESLPKKFRPLPDRDNIVVSTNRNYSAVDATVVKCCSTARELAFIRAEHDNVKDIWIIGGESVYDSFAPIADHHYVTYVHEEYPGDARGPCLDGMQLRNIEPRNQNGEEVGVPKYTYLTYERRS